jgi:hypothetical protein
MFSMAVYTWKGAFFSQALINTSENTSVGDLWLRIFFLIFLDSRSGITKCKLV